MWQDAHRGAKRYFPVVFAGVEVLRVGPDFVKAGAVKQGACGFAKDHALGVDDVVVAAFVGQHDAVAGVYGGCLRGFDLRASLNEDVELLLGVVKTQQGYVLPVKQIGIGGVAVTAVDKKDG